jgi:hypothetical protein
LFISNGNAQQVKIAANISNSIQQLSNATNFKILANNGSLVNAGNNTLSASNIDDSEDLADASNIHFHLTVPRYYSPYEEVPFLYFINSSTKTYTNQEKHYFCLHMGSSPFSPTYGLLLTNISSGSYTFHIGRAYNQTWFVEIKYYSLYDSSYS